MNGVAQDSAKDGRRKEGAPDKAARPKRFYKSVSVTDQPDGFALQLDGRPVRTPGKAPLVLPTRALAEAVAEEWRAQGDRIDPTTMPLTRLANSVIDGVVGREAAVIDDILAFAGSDLLCYRAAGPQGLLEAQKKHWDPVLAWARETFRAPLILTEGVVHIAQPGESLENIKARLVGRDGFALAALHVMAALTGSALLALGVALGQLTPDEAWQAAHVDEDWQISQWGEDAEASERRKNRWRDFAAAARFYRSLESA